MPVVLDEILNNLHLSDFIDIMISATIFYVLLNLLLQSPIRKLITAIIFSICLYLVANHFGLFLTLHIFQVLFAIGIIAFIVIYHEELKIFLDTVSKFNLFNKKSKDLQILDLDLFSESVSKLASERVGALMVFKGRDTLEPFLNGGIALNGLMSKPLLLSIFDSSSAGHDGALVFESGIITKFACHLPITKNYQLLAGRGTRHAAAIGLSEKTDALVIVVSEESGSISLVEHGQIKTMDSISQFKSLISSYFLSKAPKEKNCSTPKKRKIISKNLPKQAFSLLTAMIAWYVFAFNPNIIQRTFSVPIVYRYLPEQLKVIEDSTNLVKVTISAFERDFKFIDPGNFRAVIDMSKAKLGTQFMHISREDLNIPSRFSIYQMRPASIKLKVGKKIAESK